MSVSETLLDDILKDPYPGFKKDPEEGVVKENVKMTLPHHLVKREEEMESFSAPAGADLGQRPTPRFVADPKLEPGNSTIPWETPARRGGRQGGGDAKASHHCHREVTEVAHFPHHHLLPTSLVSFPAPTSSMTTKVTVWCHTGDNKDCLRPPAGSGCQVGTEGAASSAPRRQQANPGEDEEGFTPRSPQPRRTTRADLKKRYRD